MASACAIARQKLTQYVDRLTPGSIADKGGSVIKGGMIGGVSAPLKGLVGNVSYGGYKVLAQQPLEAAFDYIQSVGKSIASGGKIKPHEFREVVNALDKGGLRAYAKGAKAGAKTVTDGMKAGRAAQRALAPGSGFGKWISTYMDEVTARLNADVSRLGVNTPTTVRIENPVMRAMTEAAFAAVEAVDRPFFEGAFEMSHYMQAKLSAVRQGLKGAAREAEINRLMANPTDEMMTRSLLDAQYATFKDKGAVATGIENFRRRMVQLANDQKGTPGSRAGGAAVSLTMDVVMPFTGVPTSIVSKGASMTPLGLLSPKMLDGQAGRSRALANVTLGSGMLAAGYALAKDGLLEGPMPRGANERDDIDATGDFNAIKLGGKWVAINELGPLAAPLFAGAALARQERDQPDAELPDRAAAMAGAVGRGVVDNSFMQGTKRFIDAVGDEKKVPAFAAGVAGAAIPAAVGQVSRIMDPVEREAKTFSERLMNRTPLRSRLPEKATPFGKQPEKSTLERISPSLPMKVSDDRSTAETREIRRLGLAVGTPDRTMRRGGEQIELPESVYREVVDLQGKYVLEDIRKEMNRPGYRLMSDEDRREVLRKIIADAKADARKPVDRLQR